MAQHVLGLSAHTSSSAAACVRDGVPIAAAGEATFSGFRRDGGFPKQAVRFCLRRAGIASEQLDRVAFFAKPLRRFERVIVSHLRAFPSSPRGFASDLFQWLGSRLWMRNNVVGELGVAPDQVVFCEHHEALAAAACVTSPFAEASVLTFGSDGEWASTALSHVRDGSVRVLREVHHPHALTALFDAVGRFIGFDPTVDRDRVVALAGFGEPTRVDALRQLIDLRADGSFALDAAFARGARRVDERLRQALGAPRHPGDPIRSRGADRSDADLARSLQEVLLEAVLGVSRALLATGGPPRLCLAGDLPLDGATQRRLLTEGPFEALHVVPMGGSAIAALGAAALASGAVAGGAARLALGPDAADAAGPGACELGSDGAVVAAAEERLNASKLVGWVRGPLEFADHTLGGRSAFCDPASLELAERLKRDVTRQDEHVPAGVVVRDEDVGDWFHVPSGAAALLPSGEIALVPKDGRGERVAGARHADGTVRVRTVDAGRDPVLAALLGRLGAIRAAPLLLEASLRLPGEPLVKDEGAAIRLFERSRLDALFVERRLYERPA